MIIVPDEGKIPWWRILWSLLAALLIGLMGAIALMTDMNSPGPVHIAIELVALPFVRLIGPRSDIAILMAAAASVILWWGVVLLLLLRRMRKYNRATPA